MVTFARLSEAAASTPSGGRFLARERPSLFTIGRRSMMPAFGLVLALLSWPIVRISPIGDLDGSWQAAIYLAFERGLRWGHDLVFTYGPYGFLSVPQLYSPRLGALAWAFVAAVHVALVLLIVHRSMRRETLWIGVPLAIAGAVTAHVLPTVALSLIGLILAIELLAIAAKDPGDRRIPIGLAALGIAGSAVLMIKLNDGITILAIFAVMAFILPVGRRTVATVLAASAVVAVALWLIAGQQIPDLVPFFATGAEIVSGYSAAMGVTDPTRDWQLFALGVGVLLLASAIVQQTRVWPSRMRLGAMVVIAIVCFLAYKEAFVRHKGGGFFEIVLIVAVWGLPWDRTQRQHRLLLLAAFAIAALGVSGVNPTTYMSAEAPGRAIKQAMTILTTTDRVATIESSREAMRAKYGMPDGFIAAIGDRSVHIEPYLTSVAWAYPQLHWRPLPVFQTYLAFTESLDGLDAATLESASAPEVILRHAPASIDNRDPFLDAPSSALAVLCGYVEARATEQWQMLERSENRCGQPELLGRVTFAPGELVTVPTDARPGRIVVVHIAGIEAGPLAAARAFLYKSPTWQMWRTHISRARLVPKLAEGPLIMSVPDAVAWSEPFRPPTTTTFQIVKGYRNGRADTAQPSITLEATFESVPYGPP